MKRTYYLLLVFCFFSNIYAKNETFIQESKPQEFFEIHENPRNTENQFKIVSKKLTTLNSILEELRSNFENVEDTEKEQMLIDLHKFQKSFDSVFEELKLISNKLPHQKKSIQNQIIDLNKKFKNFAKNLNTYISTYSSKSQKSNQDKNQLLLMNTKLSAIIKNLYKLSTLKIQNTSPKKDIANISHTIKNYDENTSNLYKKIQVKLQSEIKNNFLSLVKITNQSFKIKINNTILFGKAEVSIKPKGLITLKKIAQVFKLFPDTEIYVIGHADKDKIQKNSLLFQYYPTNWELSTKRAVMVVRYLVEEYGVPGKHMIAGGRSYFQPSKNDDPNLNRRTEIWIMPPAKENPIIHHYDKNKPLASK